MTIARPPGRQRRPLARPAGFGDSDEWVAEAIRALPPDAPTQPPSRQETIDATGSVRVVVNAVARVRDVQISPDWRDRLDAEGLAATLLDTFRAAAQRAISAYAVARRAARAAGQPPPALGEHTEADPPGSRVHKGLGSHTGPHGYLTATTCGWEITSITVDTARVWHAPVEHLQADAVAVLTPSPWPDPGEGT